MTKNCPSCKKTLKIDIAICECGYDYDAEPCPGCEKRIPIDADECPFCHMDLSSDLTAKPVQKKVEKPAKQPKTQTVKDVVAKVNQAYPGLDGTGSETQKSTKGFRGGNRIVVAAFGRLGQDPIDYPELHLRINDPTDEQLLEWAEKLRDKYANENNNDWLLNVAIQNIAMLSKEPALNQNSKRILNLLGGNDYE